MDKLDSLLRHAADTPRPPLGFTEKVMLRVERLEENKQLRTLCYAAVGISAGLLGFFASLSLVLADVLDGVFGEVLGAMAQDPHMLFSREGWNAIMETTPFLPMLGVLGFLVLMSVSVRPFFRLVHRFLPFSLVYAHS